MTMVRWPPPTICHAIAQLRLGAGRAVVELARAQRRLGQMVLVAVAADVDEQWRSDPAMVSALESADVRVAPLGAWFRRDPARIRDAAGQLRDCLRGAPLLVHAHLAPAVSIGQLAGATTIVATCHGWNPNRPPEYDLQDAAALQQCAVVTSPSKFWADRLRREWLVPRVEVVPYGLDLSLEPDDERPGAYDGPPRIVTVCELTRRKGVDVLLDAMAMLWRDVPEATLNIFGRGDDESSLRSHAARIDPGGQRIRFEGWVEAPRSRLETYSLFALATRSDNYPLAIMESMLSGLAIVATRVGGIPEAIDEAGCGEVVPPERPDLLADAIRRLVRDPAAAAAMGARGRVYARARFNVDAIAQTFARLYHER